ncbi:MAG: hypothetical protein ACNA7W_18665, partial [Pseudomonadales bacterium]
GTLPASVAVLDGAEPRLRARLRWVEPYEIDAPGVAETGLRAVLEGLEAGDRVVVGGAVFELRDSQPIVVERTLPQLTPGD